MLIFPIGKVKQVSNISRMEPRMLLEYISRLHQLGVHLTFHFFIKKKKKKKGWQLVKVENFNNAKNDHCLCWNKWMHWLKFAMYIIMKLIDSRSYTMRCV